MEESNNMNDIINNLQNMLLNNNSDEQSSNFNNNASADNNNSNNNFNFDINTIMMLKKIMDAMNQNSNDSRSTLLYSLKPYLRKDKQDKIDQYVQLLKLEQILKVFNQTSGGGTN